MYCNAPNLPLLPVYSVHTASMNTAFPAMRANRHVYTCPNRFLANVVVFQGIMSAHAALGTDSWQTLGPVLITLVRPSLVHCHLSLYLPSSLLIGTDV